MSCIGNRIFIKLEIIFFCHSDVSSSIFNVSVCPAYLMYIDKQNNNSIAPTWCLLERFSSFDHIIQDKN